MGGVRLGHELRYTGQLLCILLVEGGGRADGIEELVDGGALPLGGGGIMVKMIDVHGADVRREDGEGGGRTGGRSRRGRVVARHQVRSLVRRYPACLLWKHKRCCLSLPRAHLAITHSR